MPYNDSHRALAQAFLARPQVTAREARVILAAILSAEDPENEISPAEVSEGMVASYVGQLNDELSKFDFEIRSMRDQKDRSTIYALVNTTPDAIIQGATEYSADEIAFFRRLLDAMFETNNTLHAEVFAVRSHDAIHLNKNPPRAADDEIQVAAESQASSSGGLTLKGAEEALAKFVDGGWLLRSRANWYSLAPRGLMELAVYLIQTYNHESDDSDDEIRVVKACFACRELLTMGQRCEKLACTVRLHEPCAEHFFKVHKDRKCPKCKRPWTGNELVGEGAVGKLKKRRDAPRVVEPAPRKRREEEDGEEDGEEDPEEREIYGGDEMEEDDE